MRILCVALLLALSVNTNAFQVRAVCQLQSGLQAVCQVCNTLNTAVYCDMRLRGLTALGFTLQEWGQGQIFPGQCMTGYVYAHNPYNDPLTYAEGYATCSF
jgi:hypothetical protein